jgi:peptidoglycan/LPS O-acetylase OafA/YrhL
MTPAGRVAVVGDAPEPSPPTSRRRVPQLDGIRGVAIVLVIWWHYVVVPNVDHPHDALTGVLSRIGLLTWSGVDLFFVLSGFLIGGILIDAKNTRRYFAPFYVRRSFRILPVYLVVCALGIWAATMSPAAEAVVGTPMPMVLYATFTQNLWLAHHSWDTWLSQTWSLAIEEQFYLTLPLVVRLVPRPKLPAAIAALALVCAAGRTLLYLHHGSGWENAAYVLTFCRGDSLLIGVLVALAVRAPRARRFLVERAWLLPAALLFFGDGVAVFIAKAWTMDAPMSTFGYTWLALFYASLLLLAVSRTNGWVARLLTAQPLRFLGNRAYCLFLVHMATFNLSSQLVNANGSEWSWSAALLGLALALGLAEISWRLLERNMIATGHRLAARMGSAATPAANSYAGPVGLGGA